MSDVFVRPSSWSHGPSISTDKRSLKKPSRQKLWRSNNSSRKQQAEALEGRKLNDKMSTAALNPSSSSPPPSPPGAPTAALLPVAPPPPKTKVPAHPSNKNKLQEYVQRSAIPLPVYQTINEGPVHAPRFRSSVTVGGMTFTSPNTFAHRKAAEQDVAMVALKAVAGRVEQDGYLLLREDPVFCKSILNEYAVKMNFPLPAYTNTQLEGLLPVFISTVTFEGITYSGEPRKNKKEAEQFAARTVIEEILASSSSSRTLMYQIIIAKGKLYASIGKPDSSVHFQACNPPTGGHLESCSLKRKRQIDPKAVTHVNCDNTHSEAAPVLTAIRPPLREAIHIKNEYLSEPEASSGSRQPQDGSFAGQRPCFDGANKKRFTSEKKTFESYDKEQWTG